MPSALARHYWQPRYWPVHLQLLLMRTVARLPLPMLRRLGALLGNVVWQLAGERKRITLRNIELCFPLMTATQRETIARENFRLTAMGLLETAQCWFGDLSKATLDIQGMAHLQQALAQGKGVLLLGFHLTDLELGGTLMSRGLNFGAMYRPHANPVFEAAMSGGRKRHLALIGRDDVRAMLRHLKKNGIVWYAADQDYGRQHSVFAPFFTIPTASITATSRFAQLSGAPVLPFTHERTPLGLRITVHPALEDFPQEAVQDATRVNLVLEDYLRAHPANYLWMHRRFKTRPDGSPSLYEERASRHGQFGISSKRLQTIINAATPIALHDGKYLNKQNDYLEVLPHVWWHWQRKPQTKTWQRVDTIKKRLRGNADYRISVQCCANLRCDLIRVAMPETINTSGLWPELLLK